MQGQVTDYLRTIEPGDEIGQSAGRREVFGPDGTQSWRFCVIATGTGIARFCLT